MSERERTAARARRFRAPARVNLIGEHTDYNDGLVMPTNTALHTWVTIRPRPDRRVCVEALDLAETRSFEIDDAAPHAESGWIDYVRGIALELEAEGLRLRGADLTIAGEIPIGAGLGSSASVEVAAALALLGVAGERLAPARIAEVCRRAERRHAGVQCGIMDPFSIACGRQGTALCLDCRSLETRFVEIPASVELLVVDSGLEHRLAKGELNQRAEECAAAVRVLSADRPAIRALRDADEAVLEANRAQLGERLHRRGRHVVREIGRVRDAFAALERSDTRALAELIRASHASLRDDFEVSCTELDELVEIADATPGVLASRMVGAGFGGCVLVLCEAGRAAEAGVRIGACYAERLGREPWHHVVRAAAPAGEVLGE